MNLTWGGNRGQGNVIFCQTVQPELSCDFLECREEYLAGKALLMNSTGDKVLVANRASHLADRLNGQFEALASEYLELSVCHNGGSEEIDRA